MCGHRGLTEQGTRKTNSCFGFSLPLVVHIKTSQETDVMMMGEGRRSTRPRLQARTIDGHQVVKC